MEYKKLTAKEYLRTIKIIHIAIVVGAIMMAMVMLTMHYSGDVVNVDGVSNIQFLIIDIVIVISLFFAGNFLFNKSMQKIHLLTELKAKTSAYITAFIIRIALLEGGVISSFILFVITGDLIIIGLGTLVLIYMIILFPSLDRICREMKLNPSEIMTLKNSNEIVAEIKQTK
ncbi:MAG: hypothetical protein C0596_01235 [Marinilabiliales bacterium]|nr:MAG: hypothetical protein C0596_01235 [Marinilabiliales bacterium]